MKPESDVTQLLQQLNDGDASAKERLAPLIYDELHKLARRHMARAALGSPRSQSNVPKPA